MLPAKPVPASGHKDAGLDFADVKGQQSAKKRLRSLRQGDITYLW